MTEDFAAFIQYFKTARNVVALTGAGISTLSGIPDFRGKNGFFVTGDLWNGFKREELFHIDFFHENPGVFYLFAGEFLYPMLEKNPSIAHRTLALLQKKGLCQAIYTQNIDTLHAKAGSNAGELHGTLAESYCIRCGKTYPANEIIPLVQKEKIPYCNSCGALTKPNVVFYGEALPEELMKNAVKDCSRADLVLVFGSSLTVYPAAGLPDRTLASGGKLAIINASRTPYDRKADFLFPDITEFCSCLLQELSLEEE